MSFPWDNRQDRLATLVEQRCSASEIANTLSLEAGHRIERNAVISRVHRTGLQLKGDACWPKSAGVKSAAARAKSDPVKADARRDRLGRTVHRNPATARIVATGFAAMKGGMPKDGALPPESPDDLAIPQSQRCTVETLAYGKCKWPVGDPGTPGFFFCGGKAMEGAPYCRCHVARAWTQRPTRRRAAA